MQDTLFELIQVAIGNREKLTRRLTPDEWVSLRLEFKKQAILGIGYVGITKLPKEQCPPIEVLAQWVHNAEKIRTRNSKITQECREVCGLLERDGFLCCLLKGQSNLSNYPEDMKPFRTAGDIDVWLARRDGSGIKETVEYFMRWNSRQGLLTPWHRVLYYHMEVMTSNGIAMEPHYRPSFLLSPFRNARLQRWFADNQQFGVAYAPDGFPVPTNSFNVVYQLVHIYRHLFEEGIGLRQLLDYFFVLRALHIEQDGLSPALPNREGERSDLWQSMGQWAEGMGVAVSADEEIMHIFSRFGMKRFASATMYVLQTVFAMPDEYLICTPNEKEGRFLLNEIMMAGNFGKYDDRLKHGGTKSQHAWEKTKHNLRLLTHYPEEVLWEPFFRVYHWIWRRFELWRY